MDNKTKGALNRHLVKFWADYIKQAITLPSKSWLLDDKKLWLAVDVPGVLVVDSEWYYKERNLYHNHLPRRLPSIVTYDCCYACKAKVPKEVLEKMNFILESMK